MSIKKNIKNIFCAALASALAGTFTASAATIYSEHGGIPYETYTYVETDSVLTAVYTKPMYEISAVLDSSHLGIEKLTSVADVSASSDKLFLLDSEQSRLVILNNDYSLFADYKGISGEDFTGAQGVFAADSAVYIADTEHARVLVCDYSGRLVKEILLPDSPLIPDDFRFRPIKIAVDSEGYVYVLSEGSYYGAILYSPEGEFLGFYGSNTVASTLTTKLLSLWERLTTTNEKRANQVSRLPYQFTDMYVDSDGFIYTSTGKTESAQIQTGVIRMLSPSGTNILDSDEVVFGEQQLASSGNAGYNIPAQSLDGLCVDGNGYIYTFDVTYGKIYVYDNECNMLNAFGGGLSFGKQKGTFRQISAIDIFGDDVVVSDSVKNSLTVFRLTEYGSMLKQAQSLTLSGDYVKAKELWQQVYAQDRNCQLALVGLAKAEYAEGNYQAAMEYSEMGYDRDTYSEAFQRVRKEYLHNNFTWIAIIAVTVIAAAGALLYVKKKKEIVVIKKRETYLYLRSVPHPAAVFTELKQKGGWSVKWAVISLLLFYISEAVKSMFGSFIFVSSSAGSLNSIILFVKTFGLVLLWTVVNWAVCTLFSGIGKLKEIFCVAAYALLPMIAGNVIYAVLTHFFVPSEVAFLSVLMTVLGIYTIFIIIVGTIIIHDFSFGRFIGTTLLTFLGIAIIIFVFVIIVILVQQLAAFFATVYQEFIYR